MKKKCLVITFCFPPYPSPESFITSKLLEGLSEFLDITVLTVQSNEEKKKVYYGTNIKLIKVKLPSIINFHNGKLDAITGKPALMYSNILFG